MPSMLERLKSHFVGPMTSAHEGYEQALQVVDEQMSTIERQRQHIKAQDARIDKLEKEADGLRSLL